MISNSDQTTMSLDESAGHLLKRKRKFHNFVVNKIRTLHETKFEKP